MDDFLNSAKIMFSITTHQAFVQVFTLKKFVFDSFLYEKNSHLKSLKGFTTTTDFLISKLYHSW